MRLLLDEMVSATVADQLRSRGHDVVAVQDPGHEHLRATDDCALLDHADGEARAVVTDNVADFLACHRSRVERGLSHHGLLLFTNDTFPRHRHAAFVGAVFGALLAELANHPGEDGTAWVRWLRPG